MKTLLNALAGARLPAILVEVSTPHAGAGPEVHQTMFGGVRIVSGPHSVLWSDGHRE